MTKAELITSIADFTGLNKKQAEAALIATFNAIETAAERGDTITIRGFGTFKMKDSPARMGRDPRTGAAISITAKRKLVFKQSSIL